MSWAAGWVPSPLYNWDTVVSPFPIIIGVRCCGGKIQKWLTTWKRQYLSKGGRLTLIKSTLLNLYFMSSFIISRKVSLGLEKIQRDFLFGEGGALENKMHLVNWQLFVCTRGMRTLVLEVSPFSTRPSSTNGERFTVERGFL